MTLQNQIEENSIKKENIKVDDFFVSDPPIEPVKEEQSQGRNLLIIFIY